MNASVNMHASRAGRRPPRIPALIILGGALAGFFAGCQLGPCGPAPVVTTRYTLADTAKVTLMDDAVRQTIECTGLQINHRKDALLEVIASLKNLGRETMVVQVSATFKGPAGETLGDETRWHLLTVEGNNTVVAKFVSRDDRAADFAVQVRGAK